MIEKLVKRWELDGRLLTKGDRLLVKYNPAEHLNLEDEFIYDGEKLVRDDNKFWLEVDNIFIDDIAFIR